MLLSQYLEENNLIKRHKAKVFDATDNGSTVTILYRVDGQRYKSEKDFSARTLTRKQYDAVEVDEKTGYLLSGKTVKKSNFWIWVLEDEDEA
jgi:hypothetical protein